MSVLLGIHRLKKSFGAKTLFSELSFGIHTGDRLGLIGPNGAGKSTLLSILAGQEEPDDGEVFRAKGLRVGYLAQTPAFGDKTVEEAIASASHDPHDPIESAFLEELISRLGLDQGTFRRDQPIATLSGGQTKKVALARELMRRPDLLLLDEPTNHLDIDSLLWLEDYLAGRENLTLLTVTHDRLFLQNVSNALIDLDPQYKEGFFRVDGDYGDYLEARETKLSGQRSEEAARANDLRNEMAWLRRGAKARTTKAKARIQGTYDLASEVAHLRTLNRKRAMTIALGTGQKPPKKLIEAKGVAKAYGERTLFSNLDLTLHSGSRLALLGRNGSGKSTLIRCLLGDESVDRGEVIRAENLSANHFDQARESLDPDKTLLENLGAEGGYVAFAGKTVFAEGYLERFRFKKEQHRLPIRVLSGGEQARLLIAKLMLREAPILVLDEPTNDLDLETLDLLREALTTFEGAVLLVTHDRFFMEQVSDGILAFPEPEDLLPDEAPGTLFRFASYLQWQAWKDARRAARESRIEKAKPARAAEKKAVKLGFKENWDWENIPSLIDEKEKELAALNDGMGAHASEPSKLVELSERATALQAEIDALFERWSAIDDKKRVE